MMKTQIPDRIMKAAKRGVGKFVFLCGCAGALVLWLAVVLSGQAALAQHGGGYALAAGDRISIKVLSWNAVTLQFETFDALAGTFEIDQNGEVALPLLGSVAAAAQTPAALAALLPELYRNRLGLGTPPSVTVEVVAFRPIYVLGDVAQPGRYEFTPGITVLQAYAVAGGGYRSVEARSDVVSNTIRTIGSISELESEIARTRMTVARLEAEMKGETTFERPDLVPHPEGEKAEELLFLLERDLFVNRYERFQTELASLDEEQALLVNEISSLDEKLSGIQRQLELLDESLGNMEELRDRGLARSPALIDLQRTQIELQARELDAQTGIFRARQQQSELSRAANDLRTGRQLRVLQELQAAQALTERNETRLGTLQNLLSVAELQMLGKDETEETTLQFQILRDSGGAQETMLATPSTALQPLDVLIVTLASTSE
ncbi:polysaccharide biosynthesis/export family protein [Limimaricola litoreus]|nr:polysaccharide biosynthesis/export family protein [Limimaricola litoreus]